MHRKKYGVFGPKQNTRNETLNPTFRLLFPNDVLGACIYNFYVFISVHLKIKSKC